ncbi:hypothetical protein HUU53_00800 [Candidatus Micrarchaeota archaeon]|nr:hypothetical protein [Candidatus Micrarchaeota archaeon]
MNSKKPSLFGTKESDCKQLVVTVLSAEWPLSTKQVYNKIKNDLNYNISYQGVHKVVKQLVDLSIISTTKNNKYELNLNWLKEIERFGRITKNAYSETKKGLTTRNTKTANIRIYTSPDDFYLILNQLVLKESTIRLASKTPAIILSKETELTPLRKTYVENLLKLTTKGVLKAKYLFSTDLTRKKILAEKDKKAINTLKKLSKITGLRLRHAPLHTVTTLVIGSKDCMIGFASPSHTDLVGILHMSSLDTKEISNIYDNIFVNANECKEFIDEIENELNPANRI